MPRHPDPDLENKILNAAEKLWRKGGDKRLTMRTVAHAAGTNTPAVYRRFRHRDDILRALLQRFRLGLAAAMAGASSAAEGCERYLDYALAHPHEYQLFFQKEYELFYSPRSNRNGTHPVGRPAREIMRRRLAEELGGTPGDHDRLLTALLMVAHGTAMLLLAKTVLPRDASMARSVFSNSVAVLLRSGV